MNPSEKELSTHISGIMRDSNDLSIRKMWARGLIVLILYEESLYPGFWNADYSENIKDPIMKKAWQQFIEGFKKIAREEGCPNY